MINFKQLYGSALNTGQHRALASTWADLIQPLHYIVDPIPNKGKAIIIQIRHYNLTGLVGFDWLSIMQNFDITVFKAKVHAGMSFTFTSNPSNFKGAVTIENFAAKRLLNKFPLIRIKCLA